jgi:hypothetical protein
MPVARELFFYWKLAPADLDAAAAALHAFHAALGIVGLRVRVLRRADDGGALATLMETYALADGVDETLRRRLVDEGDALTAPWRQGPRHAEVFEPLR